MINQCFLVLFRNRLANAFLSQELAATIVVRVFILGPDQAIVVVLLLAIQVVHKLNGLDDFLINPAIRGISVVDLFDDVLGAGVQNFRSQIGHARSLGRGAIDGEDKFIFKGISAIPVKLLQLSC